MAITILILSIAVYGIGCLLLKMKTLTWECEWLSKQFKVSIKYLHPNKEQPVLRKFYYFLDDLRKKENIFIEFHDSIKSLNKEKIATNPDLELGSCTVGVYRYLKSEFDTPENRVIRNLPKIELLNDKANKKNNGKDFYPLSFVWTYAHELGHHFAIKNFNDETEEKADEYVHTLATECFTDEEFFAVRHSIAAHSGIAIDKEKMNEIEKSIIEREIGTESAYVKNKLKKHLFGLSYLLMYPWISKN